MSDYEYLNTRIRAMGRNLLDEPVFDELLGAETPDSVIEVLLDTPYGEELRASLTELDGLAAAEDALRRSLSNTLQKVRFIAPHGARRLLSIQLNRWDVQNVLTVLRGKLHGSDRQEIVAGFIPVGEFRPAQLSELAAERDVNDVADALTTWDYRFAYSVRRYIRDHASGLLPNEFERELFTSYFEWALVQLTWDDPNEKTLKDHLKMQVDLMNVLSCLRFVSARERGNEKARLERIPGGNLKHQVLDQIESRSTVAASLEVLEDTCFSPAVERGVLVFGQTNRLSVLERFFETVVIERGIKLYHGEPFSIGVPLGFLWRKINEYLNLRLLLRGTRYEMPANTIREEMFFV